MATYYRLTVHVPDETVFNAYDYGLGTVTGHPEPSSIKEGWVEIKILYTEDHKYNAECQEARFWSGLYPARLEKVEPLGSRYKAVVE